MNPQGNPGDVPEIILDQGNPDDMPETILDRGILSQAIIVNYAEKIEKLICHIIIMRRFRHQTAGVIWTVVDYENPDDDREPQCTHGCDVTGYTGYNLIIILRFLYQCLSMPNPHNQRQRFYRLEREIIVPFESRGSETDLQGYLIKKLKFLSLVLGLPPSVQNQKTAKGLRHMAGPITIHLYNGTKITASWAVGGEENIPSAEHIERIEITEEIHNVIAVESEGLLDRLLSSGWAKKTRSIIINTGGLPNLSASHLVASIHRLVVGKGVFFGAFTDGDIGGWAIVRRLQGVTAKPQVENEYSGVPHLLWMGVHPRRVDGLPDLPPNFGLKTIAPSGASQICNAVRQGQISPLLAQAGFELIYGGVAVRSLQIIPDQLNHTMCDPIHEFLDVVLAQGRKTVGLPEKPDSNSHTRPYASGGTAFREWATNQLPRYQGWSVEPPMWSGPKALESSWNVPTMFAINWILNPLNRRPHRRFQEMEQDWLRKQEEAKATKSPILVPCLGCLDELPISSRAVWYNGPHMQPILCFECEKVYKQVHGEDVLKFQAARRELLAKA